MNNSNVTPAPKQQQSFWRTNKDTVLGGIIFTGLSIVGYWLRGIIKTKQEDKKREKDKNDRRESIIFQNEQDYDLFRRKLDLTTRDVRGRNTKNSWRKAFYSSNTTPQWYFHSYTNPTIYYECKRMRSKFLCLKPIFHGVYQAC